MGICHSLCDGQAQSVTFGLAAAGGVGAVKTVKTTVRRFRRRRYGRRVRRRKIAAGKPYGRNAGERRRKYSRRRRRRSDTGRSYLKSGSQKLRAAPGGHPRCRISSPVRFIQVFCFRPGFLYSLCNFPGEVQACSGRKDISPCMFRSGRSPRSWPSWPGFPASGSWLTAPGGS